MSAWRRSRGAGEYTARMPTIFTKIINREIPAHVVYEDDRVLAFLDIAPLSRGHVVLIPKTETATLDRLGDEDGAAIGRALPRVCRAVVEATGCADFNVLQNNGRPAHQEVMHVHFHVIPKPSAEEGLGIDWPAGTLDPEAGAELAARMRAAIEADEDPDAGA